MKPLDQKKRKTNETSNHNDSLNLNKIQKLFWDALFGDENERKTAMLVMEALTDERTNQVH